MEKARRLIADPPSGWKYGFPKELPDDMRYEDLLRQQGYQFLTLEGYVF
jgi:hypothetical protein